MNRFDETFNIANTIVIPALRAINNATPAAIELVLGTGLHESNAWLFNHQVGGGPALGMWQMEPNTFNFLLKKYQRYRPLIYNQLLKITDNKVPEFNMLINNDYLAAAMCRIHYLNVKEALPVVGDIKGQAKYWKKYYNTSKGKGREVDYINAWRNNVDVQRLYTAII